MADSKDQKTAEPTQEQPPRKSGWSRRKFIVRGGLGMMGVLGLGTFVFRNPLRRARV